MRHAVSGGRDRRQGQTKRHGDREDELRPERKPSVLCSECIAAGGLDGHHDLRWSAGGERRGPYRQMGMVPGHRHSDHSLDHDWDHQSWESQCLCHDSALYSDADSVQGDLL
ncbi:hypothetical protein SDC9_202849 [bioreactor metagenome]|uniref:Uncharacterized protein n=1 Tax=bioreactor metagenome TaxID=1076179 RepID=A0A645IWB7_9ZZZZ